MLNLTLLFRHIYKDLQDVIKTTAPLAPLQETLKNSLNRFARLNKRRQPSRPPPIGASPHSIASQLAPTNDIE